MTTPNIIRGAGRKVTVEPGSSRLADIRPRLREPEGMTEDSPEERTRANEVRRRNYAKEASNYDKEMDFFERWLLGTEHRGWACSQAVGDTLEVAIGTGLNLGHYPTDVRLNGVDLSPEMLAHAETRARKMGRTIELKEGDAQDLPFADCSFDTVVCTYALCSVPDEAQAISEMTRVLKNWRSPDTSRSCPQHCQADLLVSAAL